MASSTSEIERAERAKAETARKRKAASDAKSREMENRSRAAAMF